MRQAVLLICAVLAGCGSSQPARPEIDGPSVAPAGGEPGRPLVAKVAGTRLSPQEAADIAYGKPTAAGPAPEYPPLPASAFRAPVARYRAYSVRQAELMRREVAGLARALKRGDRGDARATWLRSYTRYLLIGAAYGSLGTLDAAIEGDLHAIERGLWTGAPLAPLPVDRLSDRVARLGPRLARMEITPLDYATRAHEILDDAQRDMLSDAVAPWSGAGVHATAASLAATEVVSGTLRPLLSGRGALPQVEAGMLGLRRELSAVRRAHGGRMPSTHELGRREREGLSGRLGATLERLASVPGALETTLPPAIPPIPPPP